MTSSNVSNMFAQVGNDVSVDPFARGKGVVSGNFAKTLQDAKEDGNNMISFSSTNTITFSNSSNAFSTSVKSSVTSKNTDTACKEDTVDSKLISDKVDKVASKIKDVIGEELDVSEEEIEEAMETLGLTNIDLLMPQNIAQLVMELKGQTESFGLLVDESFKNIMDELGQLTAQLLDDIGFSMEELQDVYFEVVEVDNQNVTDQIDVSDFNEGVDTTQFEDEPVITVNNTVQNQNVSEVDYDEQTVADELIESNDEVKVESYSDGDVKQQMQNNAGDKSQKVDIDDIQSKTESSTITADTKFEISYAPETETISLPSGESVRVQEMINQIVEQAKVLNTEEFSTIEMTLNPEGLGKIFMEVTQKGDEITAKLFAENEAVKEALENQMTNLRADLNSNTSEKVTSIEVAVGTHEFERNLEEDTNRQEQSKQEAENYRPKHRNINLNNLDELSGLMSEEEQLVAQIMRENGNTLDYQA